MCKKILYISLGLSPFVGNLAFSENFLKKLAQLKEKAKETFTQLKKTAENTVSTGKEMFTQLENTVSTGKEMFTQLENTVSTGKEMFTQLKNTAETGKEMFTQLNKTAENTVSTGKEMFTQLNKTAENTVSMGQEYDGFKETYNGFINGSGTPSSENSPISSPYPSSPYPPSQNSQLHILKNNQTLVESVWRIAHNNVGDEECEEIANEIANELRSKRVATQNIVPALKLLFEEAELDPNSEEAQTNSEEAQKLFSKVIENLQQIPTY